jgi:hypothetical protein
MTGRGEIMVIKFICDRCHRTIEAADRNYVSYTGNSADLCDECFEEFSKWMNINNYGNYERASCDYKVRTVLL